MIEVRGYIVDIDFQRLIFELLGGLGIFLYGIRMMGYGLQKSNGNKLKMILDTATANPLRAVLVGVLVTGLIQSSSATSVITLGLVSAGLMSLKQSIAVMLGANIGTTVTAFIIGFRVGDLALPIMAIGACLVFFIKSNKPSNIGQIIFGIGAIFYGLELMSTASKPLTLLDGFNDITVYLSSVPLIGVLFGTLSTAIIQSSSATIGILQGLHAESIISLEAAIPILFGDNIGTTFTAVLASIGSTINAKRMAASHVLINVIGTVVFMIFLQPFIDWMKWLKNVMDLNPEMTIAFAHGIFNVSVLVLIPLIGFIVVIVTKLIPEKDTVATNRVVYLDPLFIEQSSSIALGLAKEEIIRMGNLAVKGLEDSYQFIQTREVKYSDHAKKVEETLNVQVNQIENYLIKISSSSLTIQESEEQNNLLKVVKNFERIGDHVKNIIELNELQIATNTSMAHSAFENVDEMFKLTLAAVKNSMIAFDQNDKDKAEEVLEKENMMDKMERQLRKQSLLRSKIGTSNSSSSIIHFEFISNLEQISDLALSLANTVVEVQDQRNKNIKIMG